MNLLSVICILLIYYASVSASSCNNNTQCLYGSEYCDLNTGCLYGCKNGYSGKNCERECSAGCKECIWDGHHEECTLCAEGKYGKSCDNLCSENCRVGPSKCDRFGRCIYGCETGWQGDRCVNQECNFTNCVRCHVYQYNQYIYCLVCKDGMFWNFLKHECVNCSEFCLNGRFDCNTTNGVCMNGCKHGYFGSNCDKVCDIANCDQCSEKILNRDLSYCSKCSDGYYTFSDQCKLCSPHCKNGTCDMANGKCDDGCELGWYGERCDKACTLSNCLECQSGPFESTPPSCKQCKTGFYWQVSSCKECSAFCRGGKSACNGTDGTCYNGCQPGRYGRQCEWMCSDYCQDNACNETSGYCLTGCEDGWYGLQCDRRCPTECAYCNTFVQTRICSECLSGWYGKVCEHQCNPHCKRSSYSNYLHCEKKTGRCRDGCLAGFWGDQCQMSCSDHCQLKECNRDNGKCKFPCTEFRFGDYCEKTCPPQCKSKSPYLKACNEVTTMCVYGCQNGYYGDYCNKTCPTNCLDKKCDRVTGICSECEADMHGEMCDKFCPSNCKKNVCQQYTGYCSEGCLHGMYSKNCTLVCSATCKNRTCYALNGYCSSGCEIGYYGLECQQTCSKNCLHKTCDLTGICTEGCIRGWEGERCNKKCIGKYGYNCEHKCGHCIHNALCNVETGECPERLCKEGWTGSQCNQALYSGEPVSNKDADTMAIAGSVTAAFLLTILTIVIVTVLVKRKNINICRKPQKESQPSGEEDQALEDFGFLRQRINPAQEHQAVLSKDHYSLDREYLQIHEDICLNQQEPFMFELYNGKYKDLPVLVKSIKKDKDPDSISKFSHEVDILKTVGQHTCILNLLGFCKDQSHMFSVFENCSGENLRQRLQHLNGTSHETTNVFVFSEHIFNVFGNCLGTNLQQRLQHLRGSATDEPYLIFQIHYSELMTYALNILSGMIFLKEKQILHRLIIPVNIYLTEEPSAKLGNFHYAVDIKSADISNMEQIPKEFKPWLSVESNRRSVFSFESEIWSFGVLLLEIISLGSSISASYQEVCLTPPRSCDRKLYKLMESCWQAFPTSRPSCYQLYRRLKFIFDQTATNQEQESDVVMTTMV